MRIEGADLLQLRPVQNPHFSVFCRDQPLAAQMLQHPVHMDRRQSERVRHFCLRHRPRKGPVPDLAYGVQAGFEFAEQMRHSLVGRARPVLTSHSREIAASAALSRHSACPIQGWVSIDRRRPPCESAATLAELSAATL